MNSVSMLRPREFCKCRSKEHDLVIGVGDRKKDACPSDGVLEEAAVEESVGGDGRDDQGIKGQLQHCERRHDEVDGVLVEREKR